LRLRGECLIVQGKSFDLSGFRSIYVVGAGKASAAMAVSLEKLIGERVKDGVVIVKYGHAIACSRIRIFEAGHPIIDENGLEASKKLVELTDSAGPGDLVICLISGGGSALLSGPVSGITLSALRQTSEVLLSCGATITEINIIRKHLSRLKGGGLAGSIAEATCLCLILSDVISDPLESISSGPTAPDPHTFAEAMGVVEKYRIERDLPTSVMKYLIRGSEGEEPETPRENDPIFRNVHNIVIGSNRIALAAVEKKAKEIFFSDINETFEDGVESEFSRKLSRFIIRYGSFAVHNITNLLLNKRVNNEVMAEALRWIGQMTHSFTIAQRLSLLHRALFSSSPRVRDGAVIGISYIGDRSSSLFLKQATNQEKIPELRADMETTLKYLSEGK